MILSRIIILIWNLYRSLRIQLISFSFRNRWKLGGKLRNSSKLILIICRLKSKRLFSRIILICPIKLRIRHWLMEVGLIARIRNKNRRRDRRKNKEINKIKEMTITRIKKIMLKVMVRLNHTLHQNTIISFQSTALIWRKPVQ